MKRKNKKISAKKSKDVPKGLLVNCEAIIFLILTNVAVYFLIVRSPEFKEEISQAILYIGNLKAGNYWSILTSGFIHLNLTHLGLNMLGLFVFGRIVERRLGFFKTLLIYFGSLMISLFFTVLIYAVFMEKAVAVVGASGAVMGLLAAAMLLEPFTVTWEMIVPLPVMFKGWLFLAADLKGFLGGERDGISHLAHLCGFLSVGILVYLLSSQERRSMQVGFIVNLFSFFLFLVIKSKLGF